MKPTLLVLLCLALVPLAPARAQPALLTGFGSGTTNPLNTTTDFQPPWTGTQTSSMVSVSSVSNSSGGIYSVLNQPVNISTDLFNPRLQLTGQLIASTPSTNQFAVTLYDSSFDSLTFHYAWSSFAGSPQSGTATLFSSSGTFNGTHQALIAVGVPTP